MLYFLVRAISVTTDRKLFLGREGVGLGFVVRDAFDQIDWSPVSNRNEFDGLPPKYPCPTCGLIFYEEQSLAVHRFKGHFSERPVLILNGYELRAIREIVTRPVSQESWVFQNALLAIVNGRKMSLEEAREALSTTLVGIVDIQVHGHDGRVGSFQIEFAIPDESDMDGVDRALESLIQSGKLSRRDIYAFTEQCRQYPSASRYASGFENYLFGMLGLENFDDQSADHDVEEYTSRFNSAATYLSGFDRPPAEIVCAIVAFHYNQFDRAISCSRSPLISSVSIRFSELLRGSANLENLDLLAPGRDAFDLVLADAQTERVLRICGGKMESSNGEYAGELVSAVLNEYDKQKLRVFGAECALNARDFGTARELADPIRHVPGFEIWYESLRQRMEEVR